MGIDYDVLAREYARHRGARADVLRELISEGGLTSSSRVLDAGCGTGNYVAALGKSVGCACWGIEPSEQMLAKARSQAPAAHLLQGKAERLDCPDGSLDLVFSVDVIHHVVDRPAYFREAWRVLRKGARVCTVTDSEQIIRQRVPLCAYFPETVEPELKRYPPISDLRRMMEATGFTALKEARVRLAYQLTDIQTYRDKAFSCLHLIPADAFERGVRRMEDDLRKGPISALSQYLLLWGTK
jgi:SAM-dependent methyltransferase